MNRQEENMTNNTFIAEGSYIVDDDDNTDDSGTDGGGHKSCAPLREQDRFLPIANVAKIMKKAIPDNGKIAKDARECVQECVSEFISFITSEASERCHMEKRKTINGEDILFAMNALGFENYVEPLKLYLLKYRENAKPDKNLGPHEGYESLGEGYNPTQTIQPNLQQQATQSIDLDTQLGETILYFKTDSLHNFQI